MRCTRVEKFLPLYVAGDLAGRRAERRVASHLATCERCRDTATEFDANRDLVRAASTLPPDFDGAFYEELRRSVLAEITRGRTRLAPPASVGFAALFNARFVYAASLALVVAAVAALSLHSYVVRKSESEARRELLLANTNRARAATPATAATQTSTQAKGDERQTPSSTNETTRGNENRVAQASESSSGKRRANSDDAQNETRRSAYLTKHAPSYAKRNPLAPVVAASVNNAEEIASRNGGETGGAPEVSRIEIQTSDPNIRIIWLSPKPDDGVAQPLK